MPSQIGIWEGVECGKENATKALKLKISQNS
jgi:hypothetical protein